MTPLPKRKQSKGRTRRRRSHHALAAVRLIPCPSCRSPRPMHQVCPSCGHYRGKTVLAVESS